MSDLPDDHQIATLLRDLVGRDVSCDEQKARLTGNVMFAHYATQDAKTEAIWLWELGAGASVGAALTMLPAEEVSQAMRRGKVDEVLMDSFHEVCNVLVRLLNEAGDEAFFLKEVGIADAKKSPMGEKAKGMPQSAGFSLKVQGYQGGVTVLARN
jgi:hypothetical protein